MRGPLGTADTRDLILEMAGFDPEKLAAYIQKSADKFVEKLSATETKYFSFEGKVTDAVTQTDHGTQLKAAQSLAQLALDVAGLRKSSSRPAPDPTPAVHIDMSGWTVKQPPKQETPEEQEDE